MLVEEMKQLPPAKLQHVADMVHRLHETHRDASMKKHTMRTSSLRTLALFTIATLLAATPAFSAPPPKKVKGNIEGSTAFIPPNVAAGIYGIIVECTGNLSHLGKCRAVWEGDASVDATLAATPLAGRGWRITAADGSTMRGTLDWRALNQAGVGLYTVTGHFQLTAGTRRFQGATGTGALTGTVNVVTGKVTFRLEADLKTRK